MSTDDRPTPPHHTTDVSARQLRAYRRAARRLGIRPQVDRLLGDVGRLGRLRRDGDPTMCVGAAVAVAQAALETAVTAAANEDERALKRDALRGIVLPALQAVGYEHVEALIEAALACDIDASALLRGSHARH